MIFLLVNLAGVFLIGIIIWWFWLYKSEITSTKIERIVEIKVKNGIYQPSQLQAQVNQPVILRFIREDASPCAEYVIFSSLNISKQLPLNIPTDIVLTVNKSGEYEFACQMGMYRGKLIVI